MSNPMGATQGFAAQRAEAERVTAFLMRVYGWMCGGLAITAAVAYFVASSPALVGALVSNQLLFWAILLAPIGFVWYLRARVDDLAPNTAGALFVTYAALNGVTFSVILLAYTGASIASTFLTTSAAFGGLALYGTVTRRNLDGLGQFAMMGLVGVLVASIVGIFWQNDMFQFVLSVCGVLVFTALTAYRAQQMRELALSLPGDRIGAHAIVGALGLYLAFINLFLFLLRLFGRRR